MILTKKQIMDGERAPRWYRTAWYDFNREFYVLAPIGLHLLWRVGRWIWESSFISLRPTALELLLEKTWLDGYKQGTKLGEAMSHQSAEAAVRDYLERLRNIAKGEPNKPLSGVSGDDFDFLLFEPMEGSKNELAPPG